jgi:hypothetical protein
VRITPQMLGAPTEQGSVRRLGHILAIGITEAIAPLVAPPYQPGYA